MNLRLDNRRVSCNELKVHGVIYHMFSVWFSQDEIDDGLHRRVKGLTGQYFYSVVDGPSGCLDRQDSGQSFTFGTLRKHEIKSLGELRGN
jgi:hypothetical protein